jgi:hypothetical protein
MIDGRGPGMSSALAMSSSHFTRSILTGFVPPRFCQKYSLSHIFEKVYLVKIFFAFLFL